MGWNILQLTEYLTGGGGQGFGIRLEHLISITNFSRSEALEEAIVADVTAKLARFEEWHEVA